MDPPAFMLNKNDKLILIEGNKVHNVDPIHIAEKKKGADIQKSSESIKKKLDSDDFGWIELEPEHLDMLTRFHPLNETSKVVEKRSSSSAINKISNSMSVCSLAYGNEEEGGICTEMIKRGMGRGKVKNKTAPEDFITKQMEKYLGRDYIQPNMSFIGASKLCKAKWSGVGGILNKERKRERE